VSRAGGGGTFIGLGRWWGGREAADSGGVLILIGFEGVRGKRRWGGAVSVGQ
jgi:hypothetical protein